MMSWAKLVRLSDLAGKPLPPTDAVETVTPVRFANVVTLDDAGRRVFVRIRWGLVAPWEKELTAAKLHIHARSETIDTAKTFRNAFEERRGLLIVSTFNEGREITPTKTQQFVLTPLDAAPVGIAVIWERYEAENGIVLLTFAMVTTPPNALIGTITDRMPAVLAEEDWPKWLGEEPATVDELKAMLRPSDRPLDMKMQAKKPPPKKPGKPKRDTDQSSLF